jgi:hypothetical protein
MAGPSTSHALTEVEQMTVLNKVLNDETLSNYSSDDDSASDYDYTQLVPPVLLKVTVTMRISWPTMDWKRCPQDLCGKTSIRFPLHENHFVVCVVPSIGAVNVRQRCV